MPGPQLTGAVAVCRRVRDAVPHVPIVWGGYVPTIHPDVVLTAPYVDFAIRSQGEPALRALLAALAGGGALDAVPNLSWKSGGPVVHNALAPMAAPDDLPWLPYDRVEMDAYIQPNYLGSRTVLYNSSFGCPFSCGFCAVVNMAHQRWLAQSPGRVAAEVGHLVGRYGVNAVQMVDMDFFISESRVAEIAERFMPLNLTWWGMGRTDVLMRYAPRTWEALRRSGLRMLFTGAESGSEATLARMNKGGSAAPERTLALAALLRGYGIIPEFSFVVGTPPDPIADMEQTFAFIRKVKTVNPDAEIVIYAYTPVPSGGALFADALRAGFAFPATLAELAAPRWHRLDLRRGDGLPWMTGRVRHKVRDFEHVLNAYYPTVTDRRLTAVRRRVLRTASAWRYQAHIYRAPYELKALHRLMRYQRPETTGF
jgi:radical SAM superfamily enzyme YgiQ (UPF0313 family)